MSLTFFAFGDDGKSAYATPWIVLTYARNPKYHTDEQAGSIFTTDKYPAWQEKYIDLLGEHWDTSAKVLKDDKGLLDKLKKLGEAKKAMPFVKQLQKRLEAGEDASTVLERKLGFDEQTILLEMVPSLKRTAGFSRVVVVQVAEGTKKGRDLTAQGAEVGITAPNADSAVPGAPSFLFQNHEG